MAELKLESGREVTLRQLTQRTVYEGLLEGLPTRERNERFLRDTLEQARRDHGIVPVTLIDPPVKSIPTEEPYPFGIPESVPRVVCIGRFHSFECTSGNTDDELYYSELVAIWFQEDFLIGTEDGFPSELRQIDWDALAGDFAD